MKRLLACVLALALAGCGIKADLVKPDGKPTQKGTPDPSRPAEPLGQ